MNDSRRYLILGASGPVGSHLRRALGDERCISSYRSHPIPGGVFFDALRMRLGEVIPGNATALSHAFILLGETRIDQCAAKPDETRRLNVEATISIIDELVERGIVPVFASSDAVFDGSRGRYDETSQTSPCLTYGRQKVAVEEYLGGKSGRWIIARLGKVVGSRLPGDMLGDWLDAIQQRKQIVCARDQILSPVDVHDVAQCLALLTGDRHAGVFHLAGPDVLTRAAFLDLLIARIRESRSVEPNVSYCDLSELPVLEPRPRDCSMVAVASMQRLGYSCMTMAQACSAAVAASYPAVGTSS